MVWKGTLNLSCFAAWFIRYLLVFLPKIDGAQITLMKLLEHCKLLLISEVIMHESSSLYVIGTIFMKDLVHMHNETNERQWNQWKMMKDNRKVVKLIR